jgi:hypothetical protein
MMCGFASRGVGTKVERQTPLTIRKEFTNMNHYYIEANAGKAVANALKHLGQSEEFRLVTAEQIENEIGMDEIIDWNGLKGKRYYLLINNDCVCKKFPEKYEIVGDGETPLDTIVDYVQYVNMCDKEGAEYSARGGKPINDGLSKEERLLRCIFEDSKREEAERDELRYFIKKQIVTTAGHPKLARGKA